MTGQELVSVLRQTYLDDKATPPLWSDAELLFNINLAEEQACRRASLIEEGTTAADGTDGTSGNPVCSLTIAANTSKYVLSPKILQIKRVKLASMSYPLVPVTRSFMDDQVSGWDGTAGTGLSYPEVFLADLGNVLELYPTPTASGVASLVVTRLPLQSITLNTSPEIAPRHHDGLLDWAAHLAYLKNDSDTINLGLAQMYEQRFTARFGPLSSAYAEKLKRELPMRSRMRARPFGS